MMTEEQFERMTFEKLAIEKLEEYIKKIVSRLAAETWLDPDEALAILENIHVEMLSELKSAVETFEDDANNQTIRRIGSLKLSWEIEKAIEAISNATDLNTEEITTIFSDKPGSTLADIAFRLHKQSAHDRASF